MGRCPSVPVGSAIMPKTREESWACLFLLPLLLAKRAVWYKRTGEHDGEEDALLAQLRLSLAVQPQLVVDNLISLCKPPSGSFFHHGAVQADHFMLEEGSIRRILPACSSTSPRDDTATTSGLRASQAETGDKGQESTSRAVHRRLVLPAAIAGVRCR